MLIFVGTQVNDREKDAETWGKRRKKNIEMIIKKGGTESKN